MKVAQLHQYGGPDVLLYEDAPKPAPSAGEVLIKVESASVNFADVVRRNNDPYPFPSPLPFIPGSEVAGVVESLGDGVTTIPVGAKVFASLENGGAGGYAQYAVAKVGKVIAAASTAAKRELALKLGADAAIDYTKPDWVKEARDLTAGKGIDVVLEATGGDVLNQSLQAMGPFGRIVVYGAASRERKPVNPYAMLGLNQSLITYYVGGWFQSRPQQAIAALQKLIGFIRSGEIDVQIGHILPLSKAAEAHRILAERASVGKIILKPWGEAV